MLQHDKDRQEELRDRIRAWIPFWWPKKHADQQKLRRDLFQDIANVIDEDEVTGLNFDEVRKLLDSPAWLFIRRVAAGRLNELASALKNPESTEAQIRYSQGAISSILWLLSSPETLAQDLTSGKLRQLIGGQDG